MRWTAFICNMEIQPVGCFIFSSDLFKSSHCATTGLQLKFKHIKQKKKQNTSIHEFRIQEYVQQLFLHVGRMSTFLISGKQNVPLLSDLIQWKDLLLLLLLPAEVQACETTV